MEDKRVAYVLDRLARGMHRTLGKLFHGNQREHGSDVCPVKKRERDAKREWGAIAARAMGIFVLPAGILSATTMARKRCLYSWPYREQD
jgi:hypothetical protein